MYLWTSRIVSTTSSFRSRLGQSFLCYKALYQNEFSCFYCSDNHSPKNKYKIFRDEDSQVIFDVEEERWKKHNSLKESTSYDVKTLKRAHEVFDVQELVELLKSNQANDVCAIKLPPELNYANYMVLVTGVSQRHVTGLAELVRKEFKLRFDFSSLRSIPHIEGENSKWSALDLGNIVLHIMLDDTRKYYDLESLWAIGAKYDIRSKTVSDDALLILKEHSFSLDDLQPAIKTTTE